MKLRPHLLARSPDHAPEAAPRIAQRHHEQARPAIPPGPRVQRQRTFAVIDLSLLTREKFKTVKLMRSLPPQAPHKTLHALVAGGKTKLVNQVLIDRSSVALQTNLLLDPGPMRFAGRARKVARRWRRRLAQTRWSGWRNFTFHRSRAGGHPGGICLRRLRRPQGLVAPDRFAVHTRQPLDLSLTLLPAKQRQDRRF